jgi:hypothetical protein
VSRQRLLQRVGDPIAIGIVANEGTRGPNRHRGANGADGGLAATSTHESLETENENQDEARTGDPETRPSDFHEPHAPPQCSRWAGPERQKGD